MNFFSKWSLTKIIILINCLIALWSLYLGPDDPFNWVKQWLPLSLAGLMQGHWWEVFTCSWVHADLIGFNTLHLVFNMMSLAMLGQIIEGTLGRKHFCLIYFPAGIMAVAFFIIEIFLRSHFVWQQEFSNNVLVGASGCVMGLAAAFGVMFPNRLIMILPWPFPVRAITAIYVFCGISFVLMFTPYLDFIAHSAHIGGAVWGFIYMRMIKGSLAPQLQDDYIDFKDVEKN